MKWAHKLRPVFAAALGAVIASTLIWLSIIYWHPLHNIPDDVKDTLGTIFTGLMSLGGGMLESWRIERKAARLAEEGEG